MIAEQQKLFGVEDPEWQPGVMPTVFAMREAGYQSLASSIQNYGRQLHISCVGRRLLAHDLGWPLAPPKRVGDIRQVLRVVNRCVKYTGS